MIIYNKIKKWRNAILICICFFMVTLTVFHYFRYPEMFSSITSIKAFVVGLLFFVIIGLIIPLYEIIRYPGEQCN